MTPTVILVVIAILVGMAISVFAFGTGPKRKKIFQDIYFTVEETEGIGVLFTKTGEYSAMLKLENPVQKFSADIDGYYDFTNLMTGIMQTLGDGYALHKQDVIIRKTYHTEPDPSREFLSRSYFDYFEGRVYYETRTYITITQENKKGRLFSYDNKKWRDFLTKIRKVQSQLRDSGIQSEFLNEKEASDFVDRFFAQNFKDGTFSFTNFKADDESVGMGNTRTKVYSLVDVDSLDLPSLIRPYMNITVNNTEMPVDLMSIIDSIPEAETIIYNQILYLPNQKHELAVLDKKKNRHSSLPSPANQAAAEDIGKVQEIIARENRSLIYAHFNLMVCMSSSAGFEKVTNYLDNSFSRVGIHLSRRTYNQLELFIGSFPGNCYYLNPEYDRFLTLSNAACCLMYKEHMQHSEDTPLKIYYTDRYGVPLALDISGKEGAKKITDNSNFFCLGPSGSGKSFHMNSVVRQMWEQDTDVVMVDTGNSYEGLCEYVGGKYISYTKEKPITMNPFRLTRDELNIEKVGFLKNLIILIWKGPAAVPTKTEDRLIEQVVNDYFSAHFDGFDGYTDNQRDALHRDLYIDEQRNTSNIGKSEQEIHDMVDGKIRMMENARRKLTVDELSFNTFYEYAVQRLPDICTENKIGGIDIANFRYMMKDFYRGGTHEATLNENMDASLFDETFIVFEIDAIKDDPLLFPIVTLIIMDVFLQKMRIKKNRKVLVIEEAWKAIASPLMAEYIKYMYKTARKFWASVGVVTQEIQDIIGSPIVKEAIINNSDVVMLLDQSKFKERFDEIQSILGLTDVDCKKIFTINRLDNKTGRSFFREVFIRRGLVSGVYGVEEPRECYMTYTTERAEKEALKLYKRELRCSHQQAIEAYVRDWNLSGIGASLPFAQKVNAAGHVLNLSNGIKE